MKLCKRKYNWCPFICSGINFVIIFIFVSVSIFSNTPQPILINDAFSFVSLSTVLSWIRMEWRDYTGMIALLSMIVSYMSITCTSSALAFISNIPVSDVYANGTVTNPISNITRIASNPHKDGAYWDGIKACYATNTMFEYMVFTWTAFSFIYHLIFGWKDEIDEQKYATFLKPCCKRKLRCRRFWSQIIGSSDMDTDLGHLIAEVANEKYIQVKDHHFHVGNPVRNAAYARLDPSFTGCRGRWRSRGLFIYGSFVQVTFGCMCLLLTLMVLSIFTGIPYWGTIESPLVPLFLGISMSVIPPIGSTYTGHTSEKKPRYRWYISLFALFYGVLTASIALYKESSRTNGVIYNYDKFEEVFNCNGSVHLVDRAYECEDGHIMHTMTMIYHALTIIALVFSSILIFSGIAITCNNAKFCNKKKKGNNNSRAFFNPPGPPSGFMDYGFNDTPQ